MKITLAIITGNGVYFQLVKCGSYFGQCVCHSVAHEPPLELRELHERCMTSSNHRHLHNRPIVLLLIVVNSLSVTLSLSLSLLALTLSLANFHDAPGIFL